jgi:hypothetical protein
MRQSQAIAASLREAINEGLALITVVPEAATLHRPDTGGWCAREVIGHLIDSACNNHRRLVINQTAATLQVDSYNQDAWIAGQHYADRPAGELVALWAVYNRHLAFLIEHIPDDVLTRIRGDAQLDFPFTEPPSSAATLVNVAADYVGHLRHHLHQIETILSSV